MINHPFWGTSIFWKHPYDDALFAIGDVQKKTTSWYMLRRAIRCVKGLKRAPFRSTSLESIYNIYRWSLRLQELALLVSGLIIYKRFKVMAGKPPESTKLNRWTTHLFKNLRQVVHTLRSNPRLLLNIPLLNNHVPSVELKMKKYSSCHPGW